MDKSELSENEVLIKRAPDNTTFNMDAFIGEVRNEFSKYTKIKNLL